MGIVATDHVRKGQTRTDCRARCSHVSSAIDPSPPRTAQGRSSAQWCALAQVSSAPHPEDMTDPLLHMVSRLLQPSPGATGDLGGVSRQSWLCAQHDAACCCWGLCDVIAHSENPSRDTPTRKGSWESMTDPLRVSLSHSSRSQQAP